MTGNSAIAPGPSAVAMVPPVFARADEAGLIGKHDRLHAVPQAQLGENPGHVRLDRRLAQRQVAGQFRIAETTASTTQNVVSGSILRAASGAVVATAITRPVHGTPRSWLVTLIGSSAGPPAKPPEVADADPVDEAFPEAELGHRVQRESAKAPGTVVTRPHPSDLDECLEHGHYGALRSPSAGDDLRGRGLPG